MIVPLSQACILAAALHFGLRADVMLALKETEGGRVGEIVPNKDRAGQVISRDIGPFGVNDAAWLAYFTMRWHQPSEESAFVLLRDDGCANAMAAAEIFRTYLDEAGGNYGVAVGLYNSHSPDQASRYRQRFLAALLRLRQPKRLAE